MEPGDDVLDWLLQSDVALRWQVERDLMGVPDDVWRATRLRVATEGFGARLLALQDPDGQWAGGAFFPADFDFDGPEAAAGAGQPWTATTWSLNSLREWGVDADALGDTGERLAANSRWEYDDLPYWGGEVDVCINSWTLMNAAWLGVDTEPLARWFVEHRLPDGGWNCEWVEGSTRSSFHSTLNAVRGLLDLEQRDAGRRGTGRRGAVAPSVLDEVRAARHAGEHYLLERRLLYGLRSGEPVGEWATTFVSPARYRYSALAAADHFRSASLFEGRPPDHRLRDAIDAISAARRVDGRWAQGDRLPGRVWFDVDAPIGEPSPWLTHQALRVLSWWNSAG